MVCKGPGYERLGVPLRSWEWLRAAESCTARHGLSEGGCDRGRLILSQHCDRDHVWWSRGVIEIVIVDHVIVLIEAPCDRGTSKAFKTWNLDSSTSVGQFESLQVQMRGMFVLATETNTNSLRYARNSSINAPSRWLRSLQATPFPELKVLLFRPELFYTHKHLNDCARYKLLASQNPKFHIDCELSTFHDFIMFQQSSWQVFTFSQ